jgi:hypothetical protein
MNSCLFMTMQASTGETVKFGDARVAQIRGILVRIGIHPPCRRGRSLGFRRKVDVCGSPADAGGASGLTSGLPTPEENRSMIRLFRKMRTDVNDAGINGVARASFPSGSAQATTSPAPD